MRAEYLADLIRRARERSMDEYEIRAQKISFAYGNLALMYKYLGATEDELWDLRILCAKACDE